MSIALDLSQLVTAGDKAAEAARARRAAIAARRDAAIAGGIVLDGLPVATDDLSQSRIMGAALSAMLDPGHTVQWKTPLGFVALDAPRVLAIATAIRAHVQACFDREAALLAALAAGEDDDPEGGWPGA